jgi:hypothetical protein
LYQHGPVAYFARCQLDAHPVGHSTGLAARVLLTGDDCRGPGQRGQVSRRLDLVADNHRFA